MTSQRNPNEPFADSYRPNIDLGDDELQRMRLDRELLADPELSEGPASGGKVAMFAIAIAVVLGAVFYGLNNSSMNPAGSGSTTSERQMPPTLDGKRPSATPADTTKSK